MHVLLIFTTISIIYQTQEVWCSLSNIYPHLGTKTPYRIVANKNDSPIIFEGCEPVKIWMVTRHGTRYPSRKFIKQMTEKLPNIQAHILSNMNSGEQINLSDLDSIRKWHIFVNENDEKKLAHEGEEEMINLAERMQSRFPTLLPNIYSNTSYKFRYTDTQRTKESARYFAIGLFGRKTSNSVWYPDPLKKDPILRFYKLCNRWRKIVKKNPDTLKERQLFQKQNQIEDILDKISSKFGLEKTFSFDDIHLMYMTCAFETSWFKNARSPWCVPFSNETIKVIEYVEDLKYYWIDGYGYNLTYVQACPAIKNLVEFFARKEEHPKAVLYFTHSGTILKLLAHLGLYKDPDSLRHDNYEENEHRLWRVSKIDAFGSNLAVVLYRCGGTEKILVLHQEQIVNVVGCPKSDLCDFRAFLHAYDKSINSCNFHEMCSITQLY